MDFFLKLLTFLFVVSLVQARETAKNIKSFKLNANITYDCVDIYKQPSLSHPLLKNHKIQMEPSFSIAKTKNKITSERKSKSIIECPNGTVPILRNTKEYVANAQYWMEKHFHPLTVESHGTHIAGVRARGQGPYHGLAAWMSVHDLNISNDQISYTSIYVGSRFKDRLNYIQIGWMVNPSLFGDGRSWRFGIWKGAYGAGCYNTECSGFIQVSKTDPLTDIVPYPRKRQGERAIYVGLSQDTTTGNWWASDVRFWGRDIPIGYWPKELFDLIGFGVDIVGVTGGVQASPSGLSPPMGNGIFPTGDENKCARVKKLEISDSHFKVKGSNKFKLEKLIDNDKCYGIKPGKKHFFTIGNLFTYGGPGGESCGI